MILADTSVWVDHLRNGNRKLYKLLMMNEVCTHEFIYGELLCGNIKNSSDFFENLLQLPFLQTVQHSETIYLLKMHQLSGRGIGWIDVHLIASSYLYDAKIFTLDKKLHVIANELNILYTE
ncbi:MAG: PIN domain-containing protein [Melioribacteraceae bacterium]|nr:PIN domain-containing protein [Melioribacteraceae bacterium]